MDAHSKKAGGSLNPVKSRRKSVLLHPEEYLHWSLPKGLSDSSEGEVKLCPPTLNMLREHSAFATFAE